MFIDALLNLWESSGLANMDWRNLVMICLSFLLIYLAIGKKFEPLLLLPIAFGMLLSNLPIADLYHPEIFAGGHVHWDLLGGSDANLAVGILDFIYLGVKLGIFPCLIFMAVGAMTDFGPLIARPSSLFMGAGAQFGISFAFIIASVLGFTSSEAASIAIIGGADGPTAIFLTTHLAPHLLPAIAIAAYSYMALIPFIQPPFMKLLTTKKQRKIKMEQVRVVSKIERICFPVIVTVICTLILPSVGALIGMFMLGNIFRESGVTERLSDTAQNAMCNTVTIFLGTTVGATAVGATFLNIKTIYIIGLGLLAFIFSTIGGLLLGQLMCIISKGKINPLIGSAGVSAVPMAARVANTVGQKANPSNFLLMHAMGPNVAGVIGSAVAAGVLLGLFGG
ncbi:MAG: sodium ion-translocating decarboxylase subunit beta [Saccharofermentanaceae bacterium]